ncbi:MAG: CHASE domain-containing protein [Polyangiaceae bacterium]
MTSERPWPWFPAMVAVCGVLSLFAWQRIRVTEERIRVRTLDVASRIEHGLNLERIRTLSALDVPESSPSHSSLREQLTAVRALNPDIEHLALVQRKPGGKVRVLVEAEGAVRAADVLAGDRSSSGLFEREVGTVRNEGSMRRGWLVAYRPVVGVRGNGSSIFLVTWSESRRVHEAQAKAAAPLLICALFLLLTTSTARMLLRRRAKDTPAQARSFVLETCIVLSVGTVITVTAVLVADEEERQHREGTFRHLVQDGSERIAERIRDLRDLELESLIRFIQASNSVDEDEFETFVRHLTRNPAITAWTWCPVNLAASRAIGGTASGPTGRASYRVWQTDVPGDAVTSIGPRNNPSSRITKTGESSHGDFGCDLGSESIRRAAMVDAIRTRLPTSTLSTQFTAAPEGDPEIAIFRSIEQPDGSGRVLGFVVASLIPRLLFERGQVVNAQNLELGLVSPRGAVQVLASSGAIPARVAGVSADIRTVFAFGRTFVVTARPSQNFIEEYPLRVGLMIALTGLSLTLGLSLFMLYVGRGRERIEILVAERTREIHAARAFLSPAVRREQCGHATHQSGDSADRRCE